MKNTSKHISEFTTDQTLQIINWARNKCNVPAKVIESPEARIIIAEGEVKSYLIEVRLGEQVYSPLN